MVFANIAAGPQAPAPAPAKITEAATGCEEGTIPKPVAFLC
jgi:hypothetical protein